MKYKKFIKHLHENNCYKLRKGSNHSVFKNRLNGNKTAVPRHTDLHELLCKKICKQLGIPII
ncbi:MAG: addiction module toxin, HicA family [Bacteroidetes bacterium CG02_land_8_20_14_3_00_31_25]|nr:addiction module toxin, HicA family [Bacteroidota bacterium]PIV58735.1 MAG: addiction module toxin, HicA family [Bacteroidetes bacterium CG02_land_8_20_14_3_00_31_25]PIY07413.1 MAG: addiction module toxin, HicA family [Bacteroidetes bacterium CG_4_10_14_3_um_filter_31_20]